MIRSHEEGFSDSLFRVGCAAYCRLDCGGPVFVKRKGFSLSLGDKIKHTTSRINSTRRRFLLACGVLAVFALARLFTLGAYPLIDPTEGRYASIALEMIDCGDWVVMHMPTGEPFWGKPPLHMWLTGLCYKVFGVSEFAARLPSFIMAVLVAALTFTLAREFGGSFFGVFSTCILVSTGLFYVYAGVSATDPSLLGTVTLAMVSFSLRATSRGTKRFRGYLFFAALGLAPLAKGLIGWVLILVPISVWATWKKSGPQSTTVSHASLGTS